MNADLATAVFVVGVLAGVAAASVRWALVPAWLREVLRQ